MKTAARLGVAIVCGAGLAQAAGVTQDTYKGWPSLALTNGLVKVQAVPSIGGRVIQYALGGFEYLWVDPQLAGTPPSPTGLAEDGGWLNYGGDKLWPAPQGWDNDRQWPGPPDAVLDGGPYTGVIATPAGPAAAIRLTSREDARSGIRFSRVITVFDHSTRVKFDTTMKNIDTKPRRWGIWQVTQLDATSRGGAGYNTEMRCYSPLNPNSVHPRGYAETFGLVNNPSFRADVSTGMAVAHYRRIVGKMGVDNVAGWIATVDGASGHVFVQRFATWPDKPYPDNTSATFWMNGAGQFVCGTNIITSKDDPASTPHLVESEVISPYASLAPGQSYAFENNWYAARIGGNYPVLDCKAAGVVCQPLAAARAGGSVRLTGRFGVFHEGSALLVCRSPSGEDCGTIGRAMPVTPREPLVLASDGTLPAGAATVALVVRDASGAAVGELAHAEVTTPAKNQ